MDFKLQKIQTALFIKGLNITGYDKYSLIGELKNSVGDIFDAEPTVLPFPSDAPLDIPRIILNSKDGIYSCRIALNRIDIFRNKPQDEQEKLENVLDNQKKQIEKIYAFFKEKKATINRVGFVAMFLTKIEDKSGAEYLRETFLVDNKLENPKELQVIYNKRAKNNSFEFNHLITLIGRQNDKFILQVDINTVPEMMTSSDFSQENLGSILNYSIQKITEIQESFPNITV